MEKRGIIYALKNTHMRITLGNNKWMYFDEATNEWVVMKHEYRKKKANELIRTESETLAIGVMIE